MGFEDILIGIIIGYLIWGTQINKNNSKRNQPKKKKRTFKEWWKDQKTYEKVLIILAWLLLLAWVIALLFGG